MKRWLILFAVCLLLPACSSNDPVGPDPVPQTTIDAILAAAGSEIGRASCRERV
mgnify:CR=1 FL=1